MRLNRWWLAVASVVMQMALGAFYAWSVFIRPLANEFQWTVPQITLAFTISVFGLGTGAFWGGLLMNRKGPRFAAVLGGILWGGGVCLASLSANRLWWLYLSYGVIGGSGLGVGYIVPVAVLVKWFPERRGLMTGLAVGGFGAGALVVAPVAARMIEAFGPLSTFAYLGVVYLVVVVLCGLVMHNPPPNWKPEGWTPSALQVSQRSSRDYTVTEAMGTWQFWMLCLFLSLNSMAGISVASQAAPLFMDLSKVTALEAARMVAIVAFGNGVGRLFWSWVSDWATRKMTLFIMFLVQAVLFWLLPSLSAPTVVLVVAFLILMCYGGGYGVLPACAADYFGPRHVGPIFGFMLLTWTFAAAFGPLVFAVMRDVTGSYASVLHIVAGVMVVSMILPALLSPPHDKKSGAVAASAEA
jgi:OFA family oxalate/formate antiporter-like MFS transporter